MDELELLTYSDAAKIAGVSRQTLREWIDSGKLKTSYVPGLKRRRIRRRTLVEFLDSLEDGNGTAA